MHSQQNEMVANKVGAVVGFFRNPEALIEATRKVREANYEKFDVYTPYPVHGLDQAQGLSRSPLPFITFAAGLTGCTLGFLLQYWTSVVDWPIIIGGKPFNSWPAFVPVMFECTILFAGLSTVGGMFLLNGLPNTGKKIYDSSITRDQFAIAIEAPDEVEGDEDYLDEEEEKARQMKRKKYKPFQEAEALEFLKKAGAQEVRSVKDERW